MTQNARLILPQDKAFLVRLPVTSQFLENQLLYFPVVLPFFRRNQVLHIFPRHIIQAQNCSKFTFILKAHIVSITAHNSPNVWYMF